MKVTCSKTESKCCSATERSRNRNGNVRFSPDKLLSFYCTSIIEESAWEGRHDIFRSLVRPLFLRQRLFRVPRYLFNGFQWNSAHIFIAWVGNGHCWKKFQGQRLIVKIMSGPNAIMSEACILTLWCWGSLVAVAVTGIIIIVVVVVVEWKCIDFNWVLKPTKSRLSVITMQTNPAVEQIVVAIVVVVVVVVGLSVCHAETYGACFSSWQWCRSHAREIMLQFEASVL